MRTSTVIWLCALQNNLQMQVLRQVQLENDLYTLFEKNCSIRYLLLNVWIISFLVLYFSIQFILIVGANISWNTLYFKSFWGWIKIWNKLCKQSTNYLISWCGSLLANFNFHDHWNLSNDIKSSTCNSKIITLHLGQSC